MTQGWIDFIAGWMGGVGGTIVGHPLDTVKVLQQTGSTNIFQCVSQIARIEGVGGFFKGMASPLLAAGVMNSVFFGVYGNTLRWLSAANQEGAAVLAPNLRDVMIAGSAAGAVQLVISCPVDLIKIKLQAQSGAAVNLYKGPLDCVQQLYRAHGIPGWYQGLRIMALRDISSYGTYMVIYEWLSYVGKRNGYNEALSTLFAGGAAGVLSWAMIMPLDFIKSRIQADSTTNSQYRGISDCIVKSYRTEGASVFFRGSLAVILRAFFVNAATFYAYDAVLKASHKK